jgi:antitoxin component YwqK of YwqJK toxin-antitoxin module
LSQRNHTQISWQPNREMKKIVSILTFVFLSNLVYSQEKTGYYFIDLNYKDTTCIYENDTLYKYVIYAIDGPGYQFCEGEKCNGLIEEYYINGNIKHTGFYKDGQIINGESIDYYKNGKTEQIGELKNGHRIGQWIWYTEEGSVEAIYQYDSIGRMMMELSFYENGNIMDYQLNNNDSSCLKLMNTYYESGELESHYFEPLCGDENERRLLREYYKNGALKLKGQYLNRYKEGVFEYYNKNGQLVKTEEYKNGGLINTAANKK